MKIAHLADIHIGVGYAGPTPLSRFQDIEKILDWTADRIIAEKCDLCLIAGDCFKDAKVMIDRASQEIASIVRFLRTLSNAGIEVIVISGTPSHDSVSSYELIKEMQIPRVFVYAKPDTCPVVKESILYIACLPGLNRSMLMTQDEYKGLPPEQVHRHMTDKISQICQGMSAQMPDNKPKILMAHLTYQGSDTGFTDLLMQQEPILTREAVAGFDLVALGHIHRPQMIDDKVFYSGPIERLSFNEEDIKPGFWIHEPGECSQFVETPARRFYTIDWDETALIHFLNNGMNGFNTSFANDLKDSIIRLHYSCSEEVAKQLNRKQLEQSLYDAGCFYVSEIKADIARVDRARDNTVNESIGPVDALAKWAGKQGIDEAEIAELQSMTEELLLC